MTLFVAEGLTKIYSTETIETKAVNNVTFQIEVGEYVVLGGPSGCGKSTLLSLMGLMETPTDGKIKFDNIEVQSMTEDERARVRGITLGFVFQAFHLVPHLTVRENIALRLEYHRNWSKKQINDQIEQACSRVGMTQRLDHYPDQLSGGQQQRAAIARALAGSPKMILADEPTGNLDSKNGDQVMELLQEVNKQGTTICLVTHDPRYLSTGRRTLQMQDGTIISDVTR